LILAAVYFILFSFWLSKSSFFKDDRLSLRYIFIFLSVKVAACFAYYWVYFCYYPAGFNGDSVSTLHDAEIMFSALPEHPMDYIRMVFGLHSELDSDPLYDPYFKNIEKWGRADVTSNFFLNDNRTPIRFNALIRLFSFGKYAVHGFVMLAISFVGQYAFYKTFKPYFPGKEIFLAFILFLTPSVLFWTSGVLKEPIAICLLGLFSYGFFKTAVHAQFRWNYILLLLFSAAIFLIIKPYILVVILIPYTLFALVNHFKIKRLLLFYFGWITLAYLGTAVVLKVFFDKDVLHTIVVRQNDFVSLSKGGIFFINGDKYVRLEYKDSTHYKEVGKNGNLFQLDRHSAFMYWNTHNLRDTIYETNNKDTSYFEMRAICAPSGSAINIDRLQYSFPSFAKLIPLSFYNVLCKPFFYDSCSLLEHLASVENLAIFLFFIICFVLRNRSIKDVNLLFCFCCIVIVSYVLIGITTTVMGAIVRYKVPFLPFLLMIPLLFLDSAFFKRIPFFKRLVK
jgi:hypothetical protein